MSNSLLENHAKTNGQVNTPPDIVEFMLDLVGYGKTTESYRWRVLDPGTGDGNFIVSVVRRYLKYWSKQGDKDVVSLNENLQELFVGIDVDILKLDQAKERLNETYLSIVGSNSYPDWSLHHQDFLRWNSGVDSYFSESVECFDLVIGNPPYVRYENITLEDRKTYSQLFRTAHERFDLYHLFVEKGYNLLREGGRLCYIMPIRFAKGRSGLELRRLLLGKSRIKTIINFDNCSVFGSILPYPMILDLVKGDVGEGMSIDYFHLHKETIEEGVLNSLLSKLQAAEYSYYHVDQSSMDAGNMVFLDNDLTSVLERIKAGMKCVFSEEYVMYSAGTATGRKKVYVVSEEFAEQLGLERDLLRKMVDTRSIKSENDIQYKLLITPYRLRQDSTTELVPESNLQQQYPNIYNYLLSHKEELSGRTCIKKNDLWYRFHEHPNLMRFNSPKIFTPDIYQRTAFLLDAEGEFHPDHSVYWMLAESTSKLRVLQKLLNSDFYDTLIKIRAKKQKNGYYRFQSQFIKDLPYPNLSDSEILEAEDIMELLLNTFGITWDEFQLFRNTV